MKKIIMPLLNILCFYCKAQEKESYYIFDRDWNPVKNVKQAKYFIHVEKKDDTTWQWDYYNFIGPRIKTESYKDEKGAIPNGFFAYYSSSGFLDSCGQVINQRKHQIWTYFQGDSGKVYLRKTYAHGFLIKTEDYRQRKEVAETDTMQKTFAKVEVESEFNGGTKAWQTYLNKNLRYPERAINAESQGMVWVLFVVDTKGKLTEPVIAK